MADFNTNLRNNSAIAQPGTANNETLPRFVPQTVFDPPRPPTLIDDWLSAQKRLSPIRLPVETGKYFTTFGVSEYSRNSLQSINQRNTISQFVLPLPLQLTDHHYVSYNDQAQIGTAWGALQTLLAQNPNQATQGSALGYVAPSALGFIPGGRAAAGIFAGWVPNNFLTVLLNGPEYKQFQLEFLLSPKSAQESENLRQIIRMCNNYMAPKMDSWAGAGGFNFPMIFHIGFSPNSNYLYRFKPSVLVNFSVGYTASGIPAFYKSSSATYNQNAPESVRLAFYFLEMEYWLRGDFKDSSDPFDTIGPRGE